MACRMFFCNCVLSSDVANPGELKWFHSCQQGFLLSSKEIYMLSHIFVCFVFSFVFSTLNAEESHFVSNVCSRLSVVHKLGLEAGVISALPDDVKS